VSFPQEPDGGDLTCSPTLSTKHTAIAELAISHRLASLNWNSMYESLPKSGFALTSAVLMPGDLTGPYRILAWIRAISVSRARRIFSEWRIPLATKLTYDGLTPNSSATRA